MLFMAEMSKNYSLIWKRLLQNILSATFVFIAMTIVTGTVWAGCGFVTVAKLNWPSADLITHIDRIILEEGFGCTVELVSGDNVSTFNSMNENAQPDLAGELWSNDIGLLVRAREEGRLHIINSGPIAGRDEGWWVPPHTVEKHPELKTVLDILEHPELFPHVDDPSKGAFIGCPAFWICHLINTNLFRAFRMEEKGWIMVDPGSGAGLNESMNEAIESGENWFGYYWSPTAMVGKYNMVKIPFGVPFAGNENWENCIVKPEQECADPQPSSWGQPKVHTIVTDRLKKEEAMVVDYLERRVFPATVLNDLLAYMQESRVDVPEAAMLFLRKYEAIWTEWVSPDVAVEVKKLTHR